MAKKEKEATKEATLDDVIKVIKTMVTNQSNQQKQIDSLTKLASGNGHAVEEDFTLNEGGSEEGSREEDKEYPYEHSIGDGQAKQDLVRHAFDTPENRRSEMTETPRMLVTPTSYVEAMTEFWDNIRKDKAKGGKGRSKETLVSIFIRKRDKRMVSVGRRGRMEAMAFSQIQQEKEATPDQEFGL